MRDQTNEKIGRVKLLLAQLQQANDASLAAALAEALLLQSGLAYRCLLAELAAEHGVSATAANSAGELAAALAVQQVIVAEVNELAQLERQQAWPHTLLNAGQVRSNAATQHHAPASKDDSSLIAAIQVDEQPGDSLNYADCEKIYLALRASIEHMRDMAQEW